MLQLTENEISNVSGGLCAKTVYSRAATILTGVGTALQGYGQILHANLAKQNEKLEGAEPVIGTKAQKIAAIVIGTVGFIINIGAITMSSFAASEPDCIINSGNNNSTAP
jgi:hypothetical protein